MRVFWTRGCSETFFWWQRISLYLTSENFRVFISDTRDIDSGICMTPLFSLIFFPKMRRFAPKISMSLLTFKNPWLLIMTNPRMISESYLQRIQILISYLLELFWDTVIDVCEAVIMMEKYQRYSDILELCAEVTWVLYFHNTSLLSLACW